MARKKRICIGSGYQYEFSGKRRWRTAPDDKWDTVAGGLVCGEVVGTRLIDGVPCVVVRHGSKYVAVTKQSARPAE